MRKSNVKLSRITAGLLSLIFTFSNVTTCFADELSEENYTDSQIVQAESTEDEQEVDQPEEDQGESQVEDAGVIEEEGQVEEADETDPDKDIGEAEYTDDTDLEQEALDAIQPVRITTSTFPDAAFRAYVSGTFDKNGDGTLDYDEILVARNIWCNGRGIQSLKGIEYLVELRGIYCMDNEISSWDLSKNKLLTGIWCSGNNFTRLDFSMLPDLEWVYCHDNDLTYLNVTKNPKLSYLEVNTNERLGKIDVSHNPELEHLLVGSCGLTSLDVTHNPKLGHLDAFRNKFKTLDLSKNTKLKRLDVWDNAGLGSVDVSNCPGLQFYSCAHNDVTKIDVTHNPELVKLTVSYNRGLTKIDVSKNPKLEYFDCAYCSIENLDLSNNHRLYFLQAFINEFSTLDIGPCPYLIKTYNKGTKKRENPNVVGQAHSWTLDYGGQSSTGGGARDNFYFLCFPDDVTLKTTPKYNAPTSANTTIPSGVSTNQLVKREVAIQTLYEMAGKPREGVSKSRFTDVRSGAWYEPALLWAEKYSIAIGTPAVCDDRFGIGEWVSRQDLALMLMRYSEYKGLTRAIDFGRSDDFIDYFEIDFYAWEAITWACTHNIMIGKGPEGAPKSQRRILPHTAATRTDFKEMLERMYEVNGLSGVPDIANDPDPAPQPTVKNISGCTIKLNAENFVYNGRKKVPGVTVYDGNTKLTKNTDYTLTYTNNIEPGQAVIKVTGINNYTGTVNKTFVIRPMGLSSVSATPSTTSAVISWPGSYGASGYKIYVYNTAKSRYEIKATVNDANARSYTLTGLKSNTEYTVKVKAYVTSGSSNYVGGGKIVRFKTKR